MIDGEVMVMSPVAIRSLSVTVVEPVSETLPKQVMASVVPIVTLLPVTEMFPPDGLPHMVATLGK